MAPEAAEAEVREAEKPEKENGAEERGYGMSQGIVDQEGFTPLKKTNLIVVSAQSAGLEGGNFAVITVNDEAVSVDRNESNHLRGLHIVILTPDVGDVIFAGAFDTYKSSAELDAFVKQDVTEGFIVVAACMDDCSTQLSPQAKQWFEKLGSKEISQLEYRQGFAFIGVAGRTEANEQRAVDRKDRASVTQVFVVDRDSGCATVGKSQSEAAQKYLDSVTEAIRTTLKEVVDVPEIKEICEASKKLKSTISPAHLVGVLRLAIEEDLWKVVNDTEILTAYNGEEALKPEDVRGQLAKVVKGVLEEVLLSVKTQFSEIKDQVEGEAISESDLGVALKAALYELINDPSMLTLHGAEKEAQDKLTGENTDYNYDKITPL